MSVNETTNEILTEHFGYAPIGIIDDVINASNEVLYKCTAAVRKFLMEKFGDIGEIEMESGKSSSIVTEIEKGTNKFELIMEKNLDRCFDKFELYLLRNILTIPPELVKGGWVRLAHHEGVDFKIADKESAANIDARMATVKNELFVQRIKALLLKEQIESVKVFLNAIRQYKRQLKEIVTSHDTLQKDAKLPSTDAVKFLTDEAQDIIQIVIQLAEKSSILPSANSQDSSRSKYIDEVVQKTLNDLGIHETIPEDELSLISGLDRTVG